MYEGRLGISGRTQCRRSEHIIEDGEEIGRRAGETDIARRRAGVGMVDELVRVWRDDGQVQGPLSLRVRVVLLAGQQMVACQEGSDGLQAPCTRWVQPRRGALPTH
jgi:hypothetical protein